ncbi:type IX secretion system sortase PorU [Flavobacterium sp.]|uniref:type IX secretion system sortase PorU n=1 Tax=Flavobacterium sp. TaxID=239 RepID=UPI0038FC2EAA
MKKSFLFLFILLSYFSHAQNTGNITINWLENRKINIGEFKIKIPVFSGESFSYDSSKKSILYTLNIPESAAINDSSVKITAVQYESLTTQQLGDLSLDNIPTSPSEFLKINISRDIKQAFLVLSPIIKDNTGFKRITSFSYSIMGNAYKNISQKTSRNSSVITKSAFANGDWYQFYIEKSGVYKISNKFLQSLGFNTAGINPKKIKVYGNGGRMLPLSNNSNYPLDITENAIQVISENDGVFNSDDYILFYAEGVDTYNEESETNVNLYDTKSYYYVTLEGGDGKRIQNMIQPTGDIFKNTTVFDDYQFHEVDLVNVVNLGRQWFGESFDFDSEQEFSFNFPNIDTSSPVKLMIKTVAAAFTNTEFKVSANGQNIASVTIPAIVSSSEAKFNTASLPPNSTIPASENIKIKLNYNNKGVPGSKGYLDYIRLTSKRKLQGYSKQFHFQYNLAASDSGIISYNISNASGISQVWDVTDIYNVTKIENQNQQSSFSIKANLGELRKYIAIDAKDYFTPLKNNNPKITNQNLKGNFYNNTIDYAIITPSFLYTQAEKLAKFHRSNSNLNVKVITLESIYHEFSSGKQDIAAIRNCIKYIYDNPLNASKKIKYVNLFGDASYDYKNRIVNNTNIVPIYQALSSNTVGESSYASDDFYVRINGEDYDNSYGGIDIAVGRMLVNDALQAEEMVNKVEEYHDVKSYGSWRNNFVVIADDSDEESDASLQLNQNSIADAVTSQNPFINASKIFLDSYDQESSAGGYRYPKARTDIFSAFEKGALVFNYLGHGGEDGLSAERIWEKSDGQNLSNQYKYPLFITITCDFSRFDNPFRPTAGEYTYWNPKGGAISMITTIREIGQVSAENFNKLFAEYLYSYENGANQYNSIAENLRLAKNKNPNSSTNVVFYIGDPAIMLAIPKPKIVLTKINDVPVSQNIDVFKSLSKMKLTGEITNEYNARLENYNGELFTNIFDKTIKRFTLNNDGNSPPINFNILGETIYRGNSKIENGQFEFSFVVPRDIRIPLGNGKISFYAKKTNQLENEYGYDSIKIGGINENAEPDNIPPTVKLYMNDENFISGGITNESPFLLANLEDENGINTASGIGHDIIAILDGNESNPYILNDYCQTNLNDFTKGTIRYPFRNLAIGLHTVTFKAWDVYNNPITDEIQFIVVGDETVTLSNVLNYPNPFVNYTEFWFTHNRPYEDLEVQVQVMTITGKVVWTKNQTIRNEGFLSREITWDGKDDFGDKIGKGVYVYRLKVKSNLTNKTTEKIEKLVKL